MTLSTKIQALQIWNQMTPMQRIEKMRQADAMKYLKHGTKRAYNKTLDLIESELKG
jgi:hypothetical protein